MKERSILFNAAMVRAILDGSKTQTRRIVNRQPADGWEFDGVMGRITSPHRHKNKFGAFIRRGFGSDFPECDIIPCPYGMPGDRLWVRETWQGPLIDEIDDWRESPDEFNKPEFCEYKADGGQTPEFINQDDEFVCRWRPSIHMPRWASRILLEVVSVRVERLNDTSEADAKAEGTTPSIVGDGLDHLKYRANYQTLWELINGDGSWEANPWVWVVEFRRAEG